MIEFNDLPNEFSEEGLSTWLKVCAGNLNVKIKHIAYHIVDDEKILQVNKDFLKHNYYTDIITFDFGTIKRLVGDIYVSIETVRYNAVKLNVAFEQEFMRVLAHGLLHLAGFEDQDAEKQKVMREMEDYCLSLRPKF